VIDHEVIDYIRDAMLADPYRDAATVYAIAELAYDNFDTYYLMGKWMRETKSELKDIYFNNLVENVNFYRGIEKNATRDFSC
jgi:hypothetical protein